MSPGSRRSTIRDVAAAAGVSQATVSRVLNNSAVVAPELQQRVLAVVAELGYRRDGLARGLRRQVNTVLGVVVPDVGNPFFTSLVRGAEDAAQLAGFMLMLCNTDEDLAKEGKYLEVLADQSVAGVILAAVDDERSDVGHLLDRGTPVVAVDRRMRRHRVDTVALDNVAGAEQATAQLITAGYRRIAMISGPEQTTTGAERLEGYRRELGRHGKKGLPAVVVDGANSVDGGYAAARRLLGRRRRPDALFVANNLMAIGALQALADARLRPVVDMGLLSFDDLPWGTDPAHVVPTVGQPAYRMGQVAAELLLQRIAGETGPPREVVLDPLLHTDVGQSRVSLR